MLALLAACRPALDGPGYTTEPVPEETAGDTAAPTTPPDSTAPTTAATGDTGAAPVACDDGLACSAESLDARGRCVETPLYDCGWPAAAPSGAIDRTAIDPGFAKNLSGVAWNPVARHLWLVRNAGPSEIWRLVEDGAGSWVVDADAYGVPAIWSDLGDLEAVAISDPSQPYAVTVLDEETASLVRYDLSVGGFAGELDRWDLSAWLPDAPPLGAEAVAFVPDDALAAWGFVDDAGAPRVSANGMGALAFVGHQNGGQIYVFDLSTADDHADPVATFDTARDDTSDLAFDASTGRLYVWHGGTSNDLEVVRLSSSPGPLRRKLDTEYVFDQPADGNLEGMGLLGIEDCADGGRSLFLTDDDGGDRAFLEYPDWPIGCPPGGP